ncbi:MAG TPA: hypothetical protein VJ302_38045, partial [Blastocatellia bacterium]|nr:hypothetical protein [Blastocatellia bacterium]
LGRAASFPRTGWPRRALAAAAVLALFVTAALWWRSSTGPVPDEMAIRDQVPLSERQPDSKPPDSGRIEAPAVTPPSPSIASAPARSSPKAPVRSRASRRGRVAEPEAGRTETASDFVALTPAVDEKAIENGMIVRLEVSRSKLIAMGFPLSVEGDQETVNAEVMMGDNGVAYAIRVVR